MVTVDSFERLGRHSKESGRLPNIDTLLHRPSRTSVSQGMSRDSFEPCRLDCALPATVRVINGAAFIVANVFCVRAIDPFPATQMAKNFPTEPDCRRAFLCILRAEGPPHDAVIEVDLLPCETEHHTRARACAQREQDKPAQMKRRLRRLEQPRSFALGQPSLFRWVVLRYPERRDEGQRPVFAGVPILGRRAQDFEISGCRWCRLGRRIGAACLYRNV